MPDVNTEKLEIQGVKYQPWKGPLFDLDDKRVLVLGESFYHGEVGPVPPDINQICLYKVANNKFEEVDGRKWPRHFQKIQKLFLPWPGPDPKEFWEKIAYYNYIAESVGKTPGMRPSEDMWLNAVEPFKAVLLHLKPRRVLVLGKHLWGNMLAASIVKNTKNQFPRLLDEKAGPVLRVVGHPASHGFSTELSKYKQTVKELLEWDVNNDS